MKNIAITIFVVLIVLTLGLYLVSFQVRETESCMVTTFGKPTRQITKPGCYFKWPFPIQQIHTFDSRMRVFEVEAEETPTDGGEAIIVKTYVVWKIADPLKFFNAVRTVKNPEDELLYNRIRSSQNNVIGRHYFSEFVNSDPEKVKFEEIEAEMLTDLQQAVAEANCGIEVKALGIKQLKVSANVSKEVFKRMTAERNRRAEAITSRGNAEAIKIRAEAKWKADELDTAAKARAKVIRGQGDAEAAKHYKMLDADPELAMFLRNLEALQKILESRTTFVTPTEVEPFDLLKGIPDLKPIEPNEPEK
ncbi:MAG: protease modulator HflC [Planctomycetota bacterium]|jgi:membrane protease subunit HflC